MNLSTRIATELRGDRVIWAIIFLLSLISIVSVYSAVANLAYRNSGGAVSGYLFKHAVILGFGLVVVYIGHLLAYTKYSRWAPTLLVMSIVLLVLTQAFGTEINGARRWLTVPFINLTFQSSDFAKLSLIIFVARSIGSKQDVIKDFKEAFVPIILPVLGICLLIALSDLSSAIMLFLICILMMIVGRVAMQYILMLILLGISVFSILVMVGSKYPNLVPRAATWEKRIETYFNPAAAKVDDRRQITGAMVAIANGGVVGVGPGNSTQRHTLYSAQSDFIYSIIVEEYGAVGGIAVIGIYLLLFFRVIRLVTRSSKAFGAMVAFGIGLSLLLQAFLNIAVNLDLLPVTGLTLPLISMGGTSTLFTCISLGILMSVSKYIEAVTADAT
ncbi:cell division protein FtsW [Lewinella marina]|uniref:Probable peptidoglycan glycosyltransferase FtsW n=1 Tax=Neolewinella marina TaxID=438751 RepID=A0A2G0CJ47_9BACT|nr:FtsW/RodA/SpoVE family cell cycle protein [Neolewinella marina]NJB84907.1 cell division protein FtsW [Neolewinella marina]PHK99940.1 cell division protein FtsW [Neolewinella marina]